MECVSTIECDPPLCNGEDCQQNATHILLENMMPHCIHTCQECYEEIRELCDFTTRLAFRIEADLGACPWIRWDETTGLMLHKITYGHYGMMRCLLQNIEVISYGKLKSETNDLLNAASEILSANIDLLKSLL